MSSVPSSAKLSGAVKREALSRKVFSDEDVTAVVTVPSIGAGASPSRVTIAPCSLKMSTRPRSPNTMSSAVPVVI